MRTGWTKQSELLTLNSKYSLHKRPAPKLEYILSEQDFEKETQRIHFHGGEYDGLLMAVYTAVKSPLADDVQAYVPVAVVQSRTADILVGWQYRDGERYLQVEQGPDRIVCIAEPDLLQWWEWLGQEAP